MRKLNDKDDFLLGADAFLENIQTNYAYDFANVLYHREKFHFDEEAIQQALENLRNNATTESGTGNTAVATAASGNQYIDGILIGANWSDATITYAFTVSSAAYDYAGTGIEVLPTTFSALNAQQEGVAHFALSDTDGVAAAYGFSVEGFTTTDFLSLGNADTTAHLRFANTDSVATARVGDFPGSLISANPDDDGDVWLGTGQGGILLTPDTGTYGWTTVLHEIGHALGLKHSQDSGYSYGAVPADMDAMEFTVMSYRSYVGGPSSGGYTNEQFGYAQTFMMLDIAALQYMYGADFTTNDGDTVYSWDPSSGDTTIDGVAAITPGGNRIFATIWDGDGYDTYDLSAYSSDLQIDLNPGKSSLFGQAQRANLGGSNFAAGNIYNAMLYEGDTRSLIEAAIGGTGDDTIAGNSADNYLVGGVGNDTVSFYSDSGGVRVYLNQDIAMGPDSGMDTIIDFENVIGGSGDDLIAGTGGDNLIEGGAGNDTMYGGGGTDTLSFVNDSGGVTVDLIAGTAEGPESGSDTFTSFENVIGGSGDDTILGKDGDNMIWANDGDDVVDGRGGADIIFGGLGNDVLDGGNGADLIYGDENMPVQLPGIGFGSGEVVRPDNAGNNWITSAIDITNAFSLSADADIFGAETVPHVSVIGTADSAVREYHVYSLTVENPGTEITLDMDYTMADGTVLSFFDSYLLLVNQSLSIVSSNDDSPLGLDPGTSTIRDSFLNYTVDIPGTYYIFVAQWDYTDFSGFLRLDAGLSYELQVSVDENIEVQGDDVINGGRGDDELHGDGGNDVIDGGRGSDIIDGGAGNDMLTGGRGADVFIFADDFGMDVILDFGWKGSDLLDFSGNSDLNSLADVLAASVQDGQDVVITLDADNVLVLEKFDLDDFSADDFIF